MKPNKMNVRDHKIAALKHAREKVASGDIEYICWALSDYCDTTDTVKSYKAVHYLRQYIAKNLGAEYDSWYKKYYQGKGLEDWLIAKGYVENLGECWCDNKKLVQTRLNWIDWMLECYGGKE